MDDDAYSPQGTDVDGRSFEPKDVTFASTRNYAGSTSGEETRALRRNPATSPSAGRGSACAVQMCRR